MNLNAPSFECIACRWFFFAFMVGFVLTSCKPPERIVAGESERRTADQDTSDTTETSDTFQQLIVGEHDKLETTDPLFIKNTSAMRWVQLVHDGLVQLDSEGEPVPQLADEWELSEDSLTYTFTLRDDAYYQDHRIFDAGRGRRVVADDVKFAFERMAANNVPDYAAELFMKIEGFEPYFSEQRNLYLPQQRQLDEVSGIETDGDTTVIFTLEEPDELFLQKLASPYALIYPQEALNNEEMVRPIGNGPFELSQQQSDSLLIFSRNEDYYGDSYRLNRIDVKFLDDATALLNQFNRREIHLIPELSPQLMESVLDEDRELSSDYTGSFELATPGGSRAYALKWNEASRTELSVLQNLFSGLVDEELSELPSDFLQVSLPEESDADASPPRELRIPRNPGTVSGYFIDYLTAVLAEEDVEVQEQTSRAPLSSTSVYFEALPLFSDAGLDSDILIIYELIHAALYQQQVENITFNNYPWWIDLSRTTIPSTDEL